MGICIPGPAVRQQGKNRGNLLVERQKNCASAFRQAQLSGKDIEDYGKLSGKSSKIASRTKNKRREGARHAGPLQIFKKQLVQAATGSRGCAGGRNGSRCDARPWPGISETLATAKKSAQRCRYRLSMWLPARRRGRQEWSAHHLHVVAVFEKTWKTGDQPWEGASQAMALDRHHRYQSAGYGV